MEDRHITVRELAKEIGVSIGSVHSILTKDLGMRRDSTKFVPKLLTMEQKQRPKTWQLHHDNAPAHSAHLIQIFVAKHNIPVVRQAPYSPDMTPCDFWLFPKLKMPLKGT
ncbi:hypothetical protein B7P43_G06040 [Cryptotermes secundus]|uniref:Tc1-like transposase DDE domain-containing protein n=1 Tax=Cryptotermes secundus TaxID=105785 RepID=A0A2J7RSL5_9NEOP|nr:hypothetical protein B7P43_G06040 [Cryptotermes secundus]